jgi:hypothetical protein
MGLQYKRHARKRMRERNISKVEVEACLKGYYTSYTDKKGNPVYVADVEGRRIKVVVQKENSQVVITTGD